mmetsp:Transcript_15576/g.33659  ORF Transcript_15576/g.33659 Transcript_15576/m.33659 type:complete len:474 (-) Transcript_15576:971-2392(-)
MHAYDSMHALPNQPRLHCLRHGIFEKGRLTNGPGEIVVVVGRGVRGGLRYDHGPTARAAPPSVFPAPPAFLLFVMASDATAITIATIVVQDIIERVLVFRVRGTYSRACVGRIGDVDRGFAVFHSLSPRVFLLARIRRLTTTLLFFHPSPRVVAELFLAVFVAFAQYLRGGVLQRHARLHVPHKLEPFGVRQVTVLFVVLHLVVQLGEVPPGFLAGSPPPVVAVAVAVVVRAVAVAVRAHGLVVGEVDSLGKGDSPSIVPVQGHGILVLQGRRTGSHLVAVVVVVVVIVAVPVGCNFLLFSLASDCGETILFAAAATAVIVIVAVLVVAVVTIVVVVAPIVVAIVVAVVILAGVVMRGREGHGSGSQAGSGVFLVQVSFVLLLVSLWFVRVVVSLLIGCRRGIMPVFHLDFVVVDVDQDVALVFFATHAVPSLGAAHASSDLSPNGIVVAIVAVVVFVVLVLVFFSCGIPGQP